MHAKSYGITLDDVTHSGIIKAIDAVSDEQWNKRPGSYRTSHCIDNFRIISWKEVIPWHLRALAPICPILRTLYMFIERRIVEQSK